MSLPPNDPYPWMRPPHDDDIPGWVPEGEEGSYAEFAAEVKVLRDETVAGFEMALAAPCEPLMVVCRGCGWQAATSDGYCLDCSPPDGFHDDDEWGDE